MKRGNERGRPTCLARLAVFPARIGLRRPQPQAIAASSVVCGGEDLREAEDWLDVAAGLVAAAGAPVAVGGAAMLGAEEHAGGPRPGPRAVGGLTVAALRVLAPLLSAQSRPAVGRGRRCAGGGVGVCLVQVSGCPIDEGCCNGNAALVGVANLSGTPHPIHCFHEVGKKL
jgi:hypothetical protein